MKAFWDWLVHFFEPMPVYTPPQASVSPVAPSIPITPPSMPPVNPDNIQYPWDTPAHCYHNVRVLCDQQGLTVDEKNRICACIYQESQFLNSAKCLNKNSAGVVTSIDWGLCQINDYYHIAPHGSPFPSKEYVLENPGAVVHWMITMYQHGGLKQWVSYSSGAYEQWLAVDSPMWRLAQPGV